MEEWHLNIVSKARGRDRSEYKITQGGRHSMNVSNARHEHQDADASHLRCRSRNEEFLRSKVVCSGSIERRPRLSTPQRGRVYSK